MRVLHDRGGPAWLHSFSSYVAPRTGWRFVPLGDCAHAGHEKIEGPLPTPVTAGAVCHGGRCMGGVPHIPLPTHTHTSQTPPTPCSPELCAPGALLGMGPRLCAPASLIFHALPQLQLPCLLPGGNTTAGTRAGATGSSGSPAHPLAVATVVLPRSFACQLGLGPSHAGGWELGSVQLIGWAPVGRMKWPGGLGPSCGLYFAHP